MIDERLAPQKYAQHQVIKALQLLANAYKHDPDLKPDRKLLQHLHLDTNLKYAPMPSSPELQKGLAMIVGLPPDSPYSHIATLFVERAQDFLNDLEARNEISRVTGGRVGTSLSELEH